MFKRTLLSIFILATLASGAQSISKSLRLARLAVDKGDFAEGAREYRKVLAKDSAHLDANLEYGLLLFEYMNEPAGAGKYLLKAEKHATTDTMPELLFGIGKYYHFKGEYQTAWSYYKRFKKHIDLKDDDGILLDREVNTYMENCRWALSDAGQVNRQRLLAINAGPGINTEFPEYVPVISADKQTLMFTSRRRVADASRIDEENGGFYEDMYMAQLDKDGAFKNPKPFSLQGSKIPGTLHKHESAISLSFVGDRFYTFFDGKIYESTRQGNEWSNPAVLNENLNHENEFRNHVCISKDGLALYYSADRPDGFGGLDLYLSVKGADGKWQRGLNLGPEVNTKADEGGPQLNEDGSVLYFSSRGHSGYGGYDFFRSTKVNGAWSKAQNMGKPFNSAGDDIYITLNNEETSGFFSSSRAGGFGDMDLYLIRLEKPFENFQSDPLNRVVIALPDTIYAGEQTTLAVKRGANAPVFSNYYWQIGDSVIPSKDGQVVYAFTQPGPARLRVQGAIGNDELAGAEKTIYVSEKPLPVVTTSTSTSTQPALAFKQVYFELNQADLNEEARQALDANAELLKTSKDLSLEIASYTDSRGSDAYNRALSGQRARAVVNYLKKKGIPAKRIKKVQALGESGLLNRCADGVECTEEEHRVNRRVEIKLGEGNK